MQNLISDKKITMSQQISSLILLYGGELIFSNDFIPTYVGGHYQPLHITLYSNFIQLQCKVIYALKIDPTTSMSL